MGIGEDMGKGEKAEIEKKKKKQGKKTFLCVEPYPGSQKADSSHTSTTDLEYTFS